MGFMNLLILILTILICSFCIILIYNFYRNCDLDGIDTLDLKENEDSENLYLISTGNSEDDEKRERLTMRERAMYNAIE